MHSVARHLPDFSSPLGLSEPIALAKSADAIFKPLLTPPSAAPAGPTAGIEALLVRAAEPKEPPVDVPELVRQAEARGHAAGEAAAQAAFEARSEEMEQAFALRLAEAREAWTLAESLRLADALRDAAAELEGRLSAAIAPILMPFLEASVGRRALDELQGLLMPLLDREDRPVLKISGPADLVEQLRTRLGDPPACVFEASDLPDVRVVAGETMLETRVRDWIEQLRQAGA